MNSNIPTREQAFNLLKKYNKNENLIKHALAVEGVMRFFARKREEDEEKWGIIGLIHDLDYEQFPEEHCRKTEEILKENNCPRNISVLWLATDGGFARMLSQKQNSKRCFMPSMSLPVWW